jgi:electron transport complex protein RnfB
MNGPVIADVLQIDRILPQTQCRQCGYTGCLPYASAIAEGSADINRCPPGGESVIAELADLLQRAPLPLDPTLITAAPSCAHIDEARCIGCTLCIAACPVDAIVGARRLMHSILADHCTGCGLCLPPCPVDCIELRPTELPYDRVRQRGIATALRSRFNARMRRLASEVPADRNADPSPPKTDKSAVLQRITRRAQQRLATRDISRRSDAGDQSR